MDAPTVTFRVVVPGTVGVAMTMVLLRVAEIPVGVLGGESVTVPENPFTLVIVRVEDWNEPWFMVRVEGFDVVAKSETMNLPCMGP